MLLAMIEEVFLFISCKIHLIASDYFPAYADRLRARFGQIRFGLSGKWLSDLESPGVRTDLKNALFVQAS